jgi:hypothetical protein
MRPMRFFLFSNKYSQKQEVGRDNIVVMLRDER